MSLTASQIVSAACMIAKVPGYAVQGGVYLNMLLSSLCQEYDFDIIKEEQTVTFNGDSGYPLNSDHLRTKEVFYNVNGSIFELFQIPIEKYHVLFNGSGVSNYPKMYATDVSTTPHTILFYPPPSITIDATVTYYPEKDTISSPETSSEVPWFLNQEYLIRKVSALLMLTTDDVRQLSEERSTEKILSKILTMADDKGGFPTTIKFDKTRFRSGVNTGPSKAFPLV
ncbi:hypothetical protein KAR91_18230 [Candidatus Pacearchaeota archaeon]|nr:hypothetical protein [Candidatus Pacearchaeota archaeon]